MDCPAERARHGWRASDLQARAGKAERSKPDTAAIRRPENQTGCPDQRYSHIYMTNPLKGITDIKRIIRATAYSFAGFKAAIVGEAAFRQELALFVILAPLGAWLGQTGIERALLIGSLMVVLIVELLNSAVEAVVNRISTERHELSGIAKDLGSAAVFVALALVVVVWALLLVPRLFT